MQPEANKDVIRAHVKTIFNQSSWSAPDGVVLPMTSALRERIHTICPHDRAPK